MLWGWLAGRPWVTLPVWLALLVGLRFLWARRRARKAAQRRAHVALQSLDAPRVVSDPAVGDTVTIEGVLRSEAPRPHPRDGSDCAAVGITLAQTRFGAAAPNTQLSYRADHLSIEVGDRAVALDGPVTIVAAKEDWWPSALRAERFPEDVVESELWPILRPGPAVVNAIRAGERVRARGRVVARREGGSYRGAGWALADVSLASPDPPRLRASLGSWFASWPWRVVTLAGVIGLLGVFMRAREVRCARACTTRGRCTKVATSLVSFRCSVASSEDCGRSNPCRVRGLCTQWFGECIAGSDAECHRSDACQQQGECTKRGHVCRLLEHADCERSAICRDDQRCFLVGKQCVANPEEHCAKSDMCRRNGRCHPNRQRKTCSVRTNEDCAQSEYCRLSGECTAVTSNGTTYCQRKSDADCRKTSGCTNWGKCSLVNGWCAVARPEDCAGPCQSYGACGLVDRGGDRKDCAPRDAKDCEASLACTKRGACRLVDGSCRGAPAKPPPPRNCAPTNGCLDDGLCTSRDGRCVAGSRADCEKSTRCIQTGRCTPKDDRCQVVSNADCQRAEICTQLDKCQAKGGACVR